MHLDIRLPMGMLFSILGVLIAGYGLIADRAIYEKSLGYNVNLVWGIVLLAFGIIMLMFGRRGTSAARKPEPDVPR
jgi:tellurite resistance protein TehA-like permease